MARPKLYCIGCHLTPDQIDEYVEAAEAEDMDPDEYVWEEEGTLNKENGHFLCTSCYIDWGMPEAPGEGWKAP